MDTNTYPGPIYTPELGRFFDPLGEYEWGDTVYKLLVYTPPRPPSKFIPAFLTRDATPAPREFENHEREDQPSYDYVRRQDLNDMKAISVKLTAREFPLDMRCKHIYGTNNKKCEHGCYVLEKGGKIKRWSCKSSDCEGHVYSDNVKEDENGVACFGKKGKRMVCVER